MGLQWCQRLGVDRLHRLGEGRQRQLGVERPGLLDVGRLYQLDVDRAGHRVADVGRPGRRVPGVDRQHQLDVDRAGRHVADEDRPGRLRRACPAGRRTGCCLGVDRPDEVRLDVGHDRLRGCRRHAVRRTQRRACPAGTRTGCCPGVERLALEQAWRLASVLEPHLAMERQGLPSRSEQQVLLRPQEPELAWHLASEPRHPG